MTTILLNAFDLTADRIDDAVAYWEEAAEIMRRADGFLATDLHRALSPETRFQLVNRAEWQSPAHFQKAIESPDFTAFARRHEGRFTYYPGLYQIVRR
jgi:quinol monooxygenase YgiN